MQAMTSWSSIRVMLFGWPFAVALVLVAEWLKHAEISKLGIEAPIFGAMIDHAYQEACLVLLAFVALAWRKTVAVVDFRDEVCG